MLLFYPLLQLQPLLCHLCTVALLNISGNWHQCSQGVRTCFILHPEQKLQWLKFRRWCWQEGWDCLHKTSTSATITSLYRQLQVQFMLEYLISLKNNKLPLSHDILSIKRMKKQVPTHNRLYMLTTQLLVIFVDRFFSSQSFYRDRFCFKSVLY